MISLKERDSFVFYFYKFSILKIKNFEEKFFIKNINKIKEKNFNKNDKLKTKKIESISPIQ
jgi:hypothetical protein